ncbi:MAG TPA: aldo/keto reductase [Candidatus Limnocylindria bacterium]|nr:aldo/keto reductase [Candidatus Limnocylindria bacterium]
MTCTHCGTPLVTGTVRLRGRIVLLLLGLALAAAWVLGGGFLHDLAEGLDRSRLPVWKLTVPLVLVAVAMVAAMRRRTEPRCPACKDPVWRPLGVREAAHPARRAVLRGVGVVVAGTVGGFAAAVGRNRGWIRVGRDFFGREPELTDAPTLDPAWKEARIRRYRRLGRTGAQVSDISMGCGQLRDPAVARAALERGVTYFDTAPDYSDTASERALGEAIRGRRQDVFLATKFCRAEGHLLNETPVPEIIETVEGSLRRLGTDYIDLIHIHSCDRLDRLLAPNIHEAFDRLKAQGKVRFLGVSTHTPNLEEVANAAIDSGRFDVLMLAYHYGMWPSFGHILAKAKANDVAVVAMKTLKGAKHTNLAPFRREAGSYAQSAFRWVLSNPDVSCLVVSFAKPQHVDEYLAASGTELTAADEARLRAYDTLVAGDYCQPHCGICLPSCPHELPIHDVLRYRMYAKDYGWEREGMRLYAALERDARQCLGCPAPCAGSCPHGIPIRPAMLDAHATLRLPLRA